MARYSECRREMLAVSFCLMVGYGGIINQYHLMNDNSAKSRVYIFSVSKEKYKLSSATNLAYRQRKKEKRFYESVLVLGDRVTFLPNGWYSSAF